MTPSGARQRPAASAEQTCAACDARCCRYTATQIDTPGSKREYDFIRWYLLHRDVSVFIDHGGGWYLEFASPCERLSDDHHCTAYAERPRICREHGNGNIECEFHGETEPYQVRFETVSEFENWLDRRGVDWRFKRRGTGRA